MYNSERPAKNCENHNLSTRTEGHDFALLFVRKKNEFLTAKTDFRLFKH